MQDFSIDDQEKFDLLAFKDSKYLFCRFNDFIKANGNSRYKLLHKRKILDTVGLKNVEDRNNQFLTEKIIHGVEFESIYSAEKKPQILETIEANYKIVRRVYQQLHHDILELFADFIKSLSSVEVEELNYDIRGNGWGTKKVTEVKNAEELMNIFQNFYSLTGLLPLSNGLLVLPDGEPAPEENKINMKQLFDLFKNTNSHGFVSLPFLGLIQYYLEESDYSPIKNATTELYRNLYYLTLSGARELKFHDVSDLIAHVSFLFKKSCC